MEPTKKKSATAIKAAVEASKKANTDALQETALKEAYQHGWDDCAARTAQLAAEAEPAAKSWWERNLW